MHLVRIHSKPHPQHDSVSPSLTNPTAVAVRREHHTPTATRFKSPVWGFLPFVQGVSCILLLLF